VGALIFLFNLWRCLPNEWAEFSKKFWFAESRSFMTKSKNISDKFNNKGILSSKARGRSVSVWVIDSILVIIASPILLVLFIVVALLIRVKLGSPILYSQLRSGYLGRNFRILKFRSMSNERDNDGNLLPDTKRLTNFGIKIRAKRLDELPSFLHILLGDMSLVGPRPLLPETIANNRLGLIRQQVRPGFTGLAQVSGNTLLSEKEKFALDCYYISKKSLPMNIWIMIKTLDVIFTSEKRDEALIIKALIYCKQLRAMEN